jgi:UDP-N-acetylglucosamine 4,6-dehydratase
VIAPTIEYSYPVDYTKNKVGGVGKLVDPEFAYSSDNNTDWLDAERLLTLLEQ